MKVVIRSLGSEASTRAHEHARERVLGALDALLPRDGEVRLWLAWDGPSMGTPTMCTVQIVTSDSSLFERAMSTDLFEAIDIAVGAARRRLAATRSPSIVRGARVA